MDDHFLNFLDVLYDITYDMDIFEHIKSYIKKERHILHKQNFKY